MSFHLFTQTLAKPTHATLRLSEILGPLSQALDMTEGQSPGHCMRCAYIGTRLGEVMGIQGEALNDLYYTLLLKDLGDFICSDHQGLSGIWPALAASFCSFRTRTRAATCLFSLGALAASLAASLVSLSA